MAAVSIPYVKTLLKTFLEIIGNIDKQVQGWAEDLLLKTYDEILTLSPDDVEYYSKKDAHRFLFFIGLLENVLVFLLDSINNGEIIASKEFLKKTKETLCHLEDVRDAFEDFYDEELGKMLNEIKEGTIELVPYSYED